MIRINQNKLLNSLFSFFPLILLFISVLNDFDFNYLGLKFFSFNFAHILIFFWTLKKIKHFGYGMVFIAGLINDVVNGIPMGVSSMSYMIICVFGSYLRHITLRPSLIKDWLFFLITISIINTVTFLVLTLFFKIQIEYFNILVNTFFTFILYIFFSYIFTIYRNNFIGEFYDN
tara:strand:- start:2421 stop:2942 length:522 start_codon:yes stop_codon:yes gene_type:complete